MRILLFGGRGQVGWELYRSLAILGDVIVVNRESKNSMRADFTCLDSLRVTVREVAPDIIVNAVAYTAVDLAEKESGLAYTVNSEAVAVLAEEALNLDAWLVHYSTDYVFDGSGCTPWHETDKFFPLNIYGRTKLDGDLAIIASGCKYLIFRVSWVYAARGKNFIDTILRLAHERDLLHVVNDQFGAPTGAELIADVTALALRSCQGQPDKGGLYHLAAGGETTWFDLARYVLHHAREIQKQSFVADEFILPVPSEKFSYIATRPHNSRLDTTRLTSTFDVRLPNWRVGVDRVLDEMLVRYREGLHET